MMVTIEQSLKALFSQGCLPPRIRLKRDWGVLQQGEVLSWSEEREGFVSVNLRWVMLAGVVREKWGFVFEEDETCEQLQLAM